MHEANLIEEEITKNWMDLKQLQILKLLKKKPTGYCPFLHLRERSEQFV